MSTSQTPPFRAEHLGSLLRPKALLDKRTAFEKGEVSQTELRATEDEAINQTVQAQLDLGFRAISDGEYRRTVFWGSFFQSLHGFTDIANPPMSMFRAYVPDVAGFIEKGDRLDQSCVCTDKVSHPGYSTLVDEFKYTRSLVPKDEQDNVKLTLISPVWYHLRYKQGRAYPTDVYANDKEYLADIAKAYRAELDILYAAGVRNVQIDDPLFAYFCSEPMIKGYAADESNEHTLDELLDLYIECYNDCLSQHADKIHFGLHICRGNFRGSRHFSSGSYSHIAAKLFTALPPIHTYYLEYDTPRAGGFEPLRHLPPTKNVVLGVVSSKFPPLEDRGVLRDRVFLAADMVARGARGVSRSGGGGVSNKEEKDNDHVVTEDERRRALTRMGVSPQCGFASHEEGNALGWSDMLAKLTLVKDVAREIWGDEA